MKTLCAACLILIAGTKPIATSDCKIDVSREEIKKFTEQADVPGALITMECRKEFEEYALDWKNKKGFWNKGEK